MSEYHVITSCNKCAGYNEVDVCDSVGGGVSEATTECIDCGFKDFWAYGHFESGTEMVSNCQKYYPGGKK